MKKLVMRLALILFGLLLLVGVEAALRLLWSPPPLAGEELTLLAIDPFRVKNGVARTDPAFKGALPEASFVVPKPAGHFRVFCLGESTTRGYPFPPDVAWPAVLERRLRVLYPGREIEVINVGGNSYGSGRILAVLRGILKYQPDLLIIATGHNEFVEDSFRAAVAQQPRPLSWAHNLYLARAIQRLLPRQEQKATFLVVNDDDNAAGFLFSPQAENTVYRVTEARRQSTLAAMAVNLAEMTALARSEQIPLFLCTEPSNLTDWPPDADATRPVAEQRERWEKLWQEGRGLVAESRLVDGLERFTSAARIWHGNAEFCYEFGQLLLRTGKIAEARPWLVRARDLDPSPVRSSTAIQGLVRHAASGVGVFFVDLAGPFDDLIFGGTDVWELLVDYVHPSPRGHAEMATLVAGALTKVLPEWGNPAPVSADFAVAERVRTSPVMNDLSADLCFVRGEVFDRKGIFDRAAEMYQLSIERGNRGPQVQYKLAIVLKKGGDLPAAIKVAKNLYANHPDWDRSALLFGYLYEHAGQAAEAAEWYQRALANGQTEIEIYSTAARLLSRSGRGDAAREILKEGLTRYPGDCRLSAQFGEMLEAIGDLPRAEAHYRDFLARDSGCQQVWEGLGLVLMNQERWADAAATFESALRQPAPLPFHHLNLGIVYHQGLGKEQLAAEQFSAFLALQPDKLEMVPPPFRKAKRWQ